MSVSPTQKLPMRITMQMTKTPTCNSNFMLPIYSKEYAEVSKAQNLKNWKHTTEQNKTKIETSPNNPTKFWKEKQTLFRTEPKQKKKGEMKNGREKLAKMKKVLVWERKWERRRRRIRGKWKRKSGKCKEELKKALRMVVRRKEVASSKAH